VADFEVDAELVIRTRSAQRGMETLSQQLGGVAQRLRGGQQAGMGMMASMLASNAITAGFGAITAGVHMATSGILELTNQMQGAQIGIATMVAGTQGISFEAAQVQAADLYAQIQQVAMVSTATSSELQDAFQTMYAGMASAGMDAGAQMQMLGGTATAAAAYMSGDLGQTSRDMSMIMSGMAGQQVKLWRPLQHLIGMSAEQWNTMAKAHPEEAARLMMEQLGSPAMTAAGEAYGRSLAGAMSTAEDFIEHFKRTAFAPFANAFGAQLGKLNAWLLAHKEALDAFFARVGARMGGALNAMAERVGARLKYVADHWDEISVKIHNAVAYVRELIPHLMATAKVWMTVRLGMMGAAAAMSAASKAAALTGAIQSGAATLREGGTLLGVGLAGAGAGGGAAATAAGGAGAAAGSAGLAASLATLGEAFAVVFPPLLVVLAVIGSVVTYVTDQWDRLVVALAPVAAVAVSIYTDFMTLGEGLWAVVEPLLEVVGGLVTFVGVIAGTALIFAIKAFSLWLRSMGNALKWVGEQVSEFTDYITEGFTSMIEALGGSLRELFQFLDTEVTRLALKIGKDGRATTAPTSGPASGPQVTPPPVVNMHGTRITVNQEFREADPDRVGIRMIEDIARFAEQRIMSGMAPALTR